jgi:hypothetical protein
MVCAFFDDLLTPLTQARHSYPPFFLTPTIRRHCSVRSPVRHPVYLYSVRFPIDSVPILYTALANNFLGLRLDLYA